MLVAGVVGDSACTLMFRGPHTYLQGSENRRMGGGRSRFFWALLCDLGLVLPLSEP